MFKRHNYTFLPHFNEEIGIDFIWMEFTGVSEKNDSNLSTENHAGFSKATFEKQLMPVLEHANRKPRYSLSCKSLRIDPKRK